MAMKQLEVLGTGKKGRQTRLGKLKKDGEREKRGKSPKSQQKALLSASMEVPLSSNVVLTQGEGYNPLAWDNTPDILRKQFPHWQTCSLSLSQSTKKETARESSTEEQPFQISQKSQLTQLSPAHGIPYVVMDGDTLNSISLKFDTTPAQLARFNKRTLAGFSIFTGDVVYVPDGEEEVDSPTSVLAVSREIPRKSAPPFLNYSSPTPERDAPPNEKSPPTNQMKASKKKLELTRSQELYPKAILEVKPGRKRTVSSSATMGHEVDQEPTETYISITSKYISDDQGCVHGVLTVSTTSLMFKPNRSDSLVQEHGLEQYELLVPLNDITHASITRDVAPPRRQPFSSPRRQSSIRTQKIDDAVVMEPLQQATPPENRQDVERHGETDGENEGKSTESREEGVANTGMERSPAPTMSDTDAESERDSGTIATSISLSDISGAPTEPHEREEKMEDEREGGEGEGEEERERKAATEEVERQTSTDSQSQTLSRQEDDDVTVNSNNQTNEIGREMASSSDDLMAMLTGETPFRPRPPAVSQCSVMSLDALLGDTAYFLHFRVVSNSGQRYTYTPVNSMRGIDIPGETGGGKAGSPPAQRIKTFFCFVVPERNLEKVVSFLSLHHPQGSAHLGSPSDKQRWTDSHFDVIHGPRSEGEELSFCDDHFKPDSWEVYSLSDLHKYRHVISLMEVEESLPLPPMSDDSLLLTNTHLRKLLIHLPSQAIGHDMQLVYSTFSHGISLRTMYRNMLAFGDTPVLLVVRDDSNKVFGAMASSYLRLSAKFYGTGESCLFTFDEDDKLEVFPWTGLNSYFIKGNTDSIAIGSGDGHFGLWLDEEFLHGSSFNCETYGNRPLATTEDFLCTGVEAWGFGRGNS